VNAVTSQPPPATPQSADAGRKPERSLGLALYSTSNILGAGVFTLPFLIPVVGLIPALVIIFLVGEAVSPLYQRLVRGAHAAQSTKVFTLATPVERIGGGQAATTLGRLGASLRTIPTILAYLSIGQVAVTLMYDVIKPLAFAALLLVAILGVTATAPLIEARVAPLAAVLKLARFWTAAMLIAQVGDLTGVVRSTVFIIGVVAGAINMGARPSREPTGSFSFGGLRGEHASAVAVLAVQIVGMAVIAILAVAAVTSGGGLQAPDLFVTPKVSSVIVAVGVALSALTGTGHVNTASYPQMQSAAGAKKVIGSSVRIAVLIQSLWMVVVAMTVSSTALSQLDGQKSFSTVGLASAVEQSAPLLGRALLVAGAVLVLFGLSGATHSTGESLAVELTPHRPELIRSVHIAICLGVAVLTVAILSAGIAVTAIVAVAGLGGGLLIMFVLPILAEPVAKHRKLRRNQAIAITAALVAMRVVGEAMAGSPAAPLASVVVGVGIAGLIAKAASNINKAAASHPGDFIDLTSRRPAQRVGSAGLDFSNAITLRRLALPGLADGSGGVGVAHHNRPQHDRSAQHHHHHRHPHHDRSARRRHHHHHHQSSCPPHRPHSGGSACPLRRTRQGNRTASASSSLDAVAG
jgi:hypothetical protein